MKVRILVKTDSFEGAPAYGKEYIKRCKKGEIIQVEQETWEALYLNFPKWFELVHENPQRSRSRGRVDKQ